MKRPFLGYNKPISSEILYVAKPLIFSNISRVIMGLVDMIMVGRLGTDAIAAVGFSEAIQWIFIASVGIATMIASQAIISRRFGQKNYNECVDALYCGQLISFVVAVPIAVFGYIYCREILNIIVDDPGILDMSVQYGRIIFIGIYFTINSFIFRAFFTGIQQTKVYFRVIVISNIINAYLNLGLIFGTEVIIEYCYDNGIGFISYLWRFYYFSAMGIEGAAIGTVIASGTGMLLYIFYLFDRDVKQNFVYLPIRLNRKMLKRHIELLIPISITEASHLIGWSFMLKIIGTLGPLSLAAFHIVNRVNHSVFMPALGIGQACSTLVGYYIGKNKKRTADIIMFQGLRISLMIMGSIGIIFIIFPSYIAALFTNSEEVISTASPLIQFCGVMALFESIGMIFFSVLEGAGDTKFVGFIGFTEMWIIFIPLCYIFVILYDIGIWGVFYAWTIQYFYVIITSSIRIIQGKWKNISL